MAQLEQQQEEKDRHILVDKPGSKVPALQAASQISLRGCAPILRAVRRKAAPDFTEPPGAPGDWNQFLPPITALPALDLANSERKPPR